MVLVIVECLLFISIIAVEPASHYVYLFNHNSSKDEYLMEMIVYYSLSLYSDDITVTVISSENVM